jgi:hypothetical protein
MLNTIVIRQTWSCFSSIPLANYGVVPEADNDYFLSSPFELITNLSFYYSTLYKATSRIVKQFPS